MDTRTLADCETKTRDTCTLVDCVTKTRDTCTLVDCVTKNNKGCGRWCLSESLMVPGFVTSVDFHMPMKSISLRRSHCSGMLMKCNCFLRCNSLSSGVISLDFFMTGLLRHIRGKSRLKSRLDRMRLDMQCSVRYNSPSPTSWGELVWPSGKALRW